MTANQLAARGDLTARGWEAMSTEGIAGAARRVVLMHSSSDPARGEFREIAGGDGYTAGGRSIRREDWRFDPETCALTLDCYVWTFTGPATGIEGAYISDSDDVVLAWWQMPEPVDMETGESFSVDGLRISR